MIGSVNLSPTWAPFDDDSGKHKGQRHIAGGRERLRRSLYAAALPASFRWNKALVETMRLPGAASAGDWIGKARRYIAAHRALDEIESAALLPTPNQNG